MTSKLVRIYQPICVKRDGARVEFKNDFWVEVRDKLNSLGVRDRTVPIHLAPHYGEAAVGIARAYDYIRVGRVRKPVDFPETLDAKGKVAPLQLEDADICEGAYLWWLFEFLFLLSATSGIRLLWLMRTIIRLVRRDDEANEAAGQPNAMSLAEIVDHPKRA